MKAAVLIPCSRLCNAGRDCSGGTTYWSIPYRDGTTRVVVLCCRHAEAYAVFTRDMTELSGWEEYEHAKLAVEVMES